jgi:hypothetical protein
VNEFQKKESGKCVEILESVGIGGAIASHGTPKLNPKRSNCGWAGDVG